MEGEGGGGVGGVGGVGEGASSSSSSSSSSSATAPTCRLVLGSSSRWRARLLARFLREEAGGAVGLGEEDPPAPAFDILAADIDEKAVRRPEPRALALAVARAKSDALLARLSADASPACVLLTCDEVIVFEGAVREKPRDEAEARVFLESYARAPLQAVCGVVAVNTATGRRAEGVDVATLRFKPLPAELVDELIRGGDVLESAGAFVLEHMREHVAALDEGGAETVEGLPRALTMRLLREVGLWDSAAPGGAGGR